MIGSAEWIVALTTLGVVMLAVVLHFEVLSLLNRQLIERARPVVHLHHHRPTLLIVMFVLLLAHVVEIWLFALAFFALDRFNELGKLIGYQDLGFLDFVYFSAANYTTVGWGDLTAQGPIRFLAGTESLVGFMLITWSASFVYLVMARTWGRSERSGRSDWPH